MNNYLNHLINRGSDHVNQVKPRLPSLFEPLPETAILRTSLISEDNSLVSPALETTEGQTAPPPPKKPEIESTVFSRINLPTVAVSASPLTTENTSTAMPPSLSRKAQPELRAEILVVPPQRLIDSLLPPVPKLIEHSGGPVIIPRERAVISSVRQPEISPERSEPNSSPVTTGTEPSPLSPSRIIPVKESPTIRPAPVPAPTIEVTSRRSRASAWESIDAPQLASSAPTIHVTIGRIEVRATPPPVSVQPKSRPAAPLMSLDDYLRQRGGGK
jgi:hypothetical protein